jgi:hypothetical protein
VRVSTLSFLAAMCRSFSVPGEKADSPAFASGTASVC